MPTIPCFRATESDPNTSDTSEYEEPGASPEEATQPVEKTESDNEIEQTEPIRMATAVTASVSAPAAASVAAPMNSAKEIRVNAPAVFDGERNKLQEWLDDCRLYTTLNHQVYTTEDQRIAFILSYMRGGTAGKWKKTWMNQHMKNNSFTPKTGDELIKEIITQFSPTDEAGDTLTKMKTATFNKDKTADEFISRFQVWVAESEITDNRALRDYFMECLPKNLRQNCLRSENPPATINEWYALARKLDNNWRRSRATEQRIQDAAHGKRRFTFEPRGHSYQSKKNPNAMDVDRITTEERDNHLKKGLCFKCHKTGHRAKECSESTETSNRMPQKTWTATKKPTSGKDVYSHIRALLKELPNEEQARFFDEANEQGFA